MFQNVKPNVVELVKEIWLMLLRALRGQYEAIQGEPDVVFRKQQQFCEIWKKGEILTYSGDKIKWTYAPPRWLFLSSVLTRPCMRVSTTRV